MKLIDLASAVEKLGQLGERPRMHAAAVRQVRATVRGWDVLAGM